MYFKIALVAYVIDRYYGEFRFFRHPIVVMGDYISFFERHFYKDSKVWGGVLLVSSLVLFTSLAHGITLLSPWWLEGIFASIFLAHHMLHESVKEALFSQNPKKALSYLVSRDTKDLSSSEIHKALIETYSENLSDGVIAPLFYLLLFGLEGIVFYKVVNTLDSMVGYRIKRYANFGYASAKMDDLLNLIPARLSALLVMLLGKRYAWKRLCTFAKGHSSPNAGYPISAMAMVQGICLGGSTSYHGKMVAKPYFGEGKGEISKEDVLAVLAMRERIDRWVLLLLIVGILIQNLE